MAVVAVWVIVTHHITNHFGRLPVCRAGVDVVLKHRVDDSALNWLQTIADIGEGTGNNHRHRIVDEAGLHLRCYLDLALRVHRGVLVCHKEGPSGVPLDVQEPDIVGVLLNEGLA